MTNITDDLKEYIDQRDTAVEQRIKLWILGSILTQLLAMAPIVFFLGGIYSDGRAAVELLQNQDEEIAAIRTAQRERERWQLSIEIWAKSKGYEPPDFPNSRRTGGLQ